MTVRRNWSREETRMAFALYFLLAPNEVDRKTADIIRLANALGRTPDAVALKIWNIAANDPNRTSSGKVGMRHGSKLDKEIWHEYHERGDGLLAEAIALLSSVSTSTNPEYESLERIEYSFEHLPEGTEKERMVCQRVNQQFFRQSLLKIYHGRCCFTGLSTLPLLVASHIKPWASCDPKTERLAPSNGLLLNALHDKAFDAGLMTIDVNYTIHVSRKVKRDHETEQWLWRFEGAPIELPSNQKPDARFIEYHNDVVFKK